MSRRSRRFHEDDIEEDPHHTLGEISYSHLGRSRHYSCRTRGSRSGRSYERSGSSKSSRPTGRRRSPPPPSNKNGGSVTERRYGSALKRRSGSYTVRFNDDDEADRLEELEVDGQYFIPTPCVAAHKTPSECSTESTGFEPEKNDLGEDWIAKESRLDIPPLRETTAVIKIEEKSKVNLAPVQTQTLPLPPPKRRTHSNVTFKSPPVMYCTSSAPRMQVPSKKTYSKLNVVNFLNNNPNDHNNNRRRRRSQTFVRGAISRATKSSKPCPIKLGTVSSSLKKNQEYVVYNLEEEEDSDDEEKDHSKSSSSGSDHHHHGSEGSNPKKANSHDKKHEDGSDNLKPNNQLPMNDDIFFRDSPRNSFAEAKKIDIQKLHEDEEEEEDYFEVDTISGGGGTTLKDSFFEHTNSNEERRRSFDGDTVHTPPFRHADVRPPEYFPPYPQPPPLQCCLPPPCLPSCPPPLTNGSSSMFQSMPPPPPGFCQEIRLDVNQCPPQVSTQIVPCPGSLSQPPCNEEPADPCSKKEDKCNKEKKEEECPCPPPAKAESCVPDPCVPVQINCTPTMIYSQSQQQVQSCSTNCYSSSPCNCNCQSRCGMLCRLRQNQRIRCQRCRVANYCRSILGRCGCRSSCCAGGSTMRNCNNNWCGGGTSVYMLPSYQTHMTSDNCAASNDVWKSEYTRMFKDWFKERPVQGNCSDKTEGKGEKSGGGCGNTGIDEGETGRDRRRDEDDDKCREGGGSSPGGRQGDDRRGSDDVCGGGGGKRKNRDGDGRLDPDSRPIRGSSERRYSYSLKSRAEERQIGGGLQGAGLHQNAGLPQQSGNPNGYPSNSGARGSYPPVVGGANGYPHGGTMNAGYPGGVGTANGYYGGGGPTSSYPYGNGPAGAYPGGGSYPGGGAQNVGSKPGEYVFLVGAGGMLMSDGSPRGGGVGNVGYPFGSFGGPYNNVAGGPFGNGMGGPYSGAGGPYNNGAGGPYNGTGGPFGNGPYNRMAGNPYDYPPQNPAFPGQGHGGTGYSETDRFGNYSPRYDGHRDPNSYRDDGYGRTPDPNNNNRHPPNGRNGKPDGHSVANKATEPSEYDDGRDWDKDPYPFFTRPAHSLYPKKHGDPNKDGNGNRGYPDDEESPFQRDRPSNLGYHHPHDDEHVRFPQTNRESYPSRHGDGIGGAHHNHHHGPHRGHHGTNKPPWDRSGPGEQNDRSPYSKGNYPSGYGDPRYRPGPYQDPRYGPYQDPRSNPWGHQDPRDGPGAYQDPRNDPRRYHNGPNGPEDYRYPDARSGPGGHPDPRSDPRNYQDRNRGPGGYRDHGAGPGQSGDRGRGPDDYDNPRDRPGGYRSGYPYPRIKNIEEADKGVGPGPWGHWGKDWPKRNQRPIDEENIDPYRKGGKKHDENPWDKKQQQPPSPKTRDNGNDGGDWDDKPGDDEYDDRNGSFDLNDNPRAKNKKKGRDGNDEEFGKKPKISTRDVGNDPVSSKSFGDEDDNRKPQTPSKRPLKKKAPPTPNEEPSKNKVPPVKSTPSKNKVPKAVPTTEEVLPPKKVPTKKKVPPPTAQPSKENVPPVSATPSNEKETSPKKAPPQKKKPLLKKIPGLNLKALKEALLIPGKDDQNKSQRSKSTESGSSDTSTSEFIVVKKTTTVKKKEELVQEEEEIQDPDNPHHHPSLDAQPTKPALRKPHSPGSKPSVNEREDRGSSDSSEDDHLFQKRPF